MLAATAWTMAGELTVVPDTAEETFGPIEKYVAANDNKPPVRRLPKIIALTGAAGAGKSTAASYLQASYDYELIKFASPLKAMIEALLFAQGASREEVERFIEGDWKEKASAYFNGRSARYAMQTLGTEWGRQCMGDNFWTSIWMQRAARFPLVVVDDCRFQNEADTVRRMGGLVVSVTGRGGISGGHSSESGGIIADHVIVNDSKPVALFGQLDKFVNSRVG